MAEECFFAISQALQVFESKSATVARAIDGGKLAVVDWGGDGLAIEFEMIECPV